MGARPKNDLAPLVRTAFVNALGLIEKDTGKTFPEMMRDCIEQHGLLAVLDKLAKYTVKEKHTMNETKLAIEKSTDAAIESWIAGFASANRKEKAKAIQGEVIPTPSVGLRSGRYDAYSGSIRKRRMCLSPSVRGC